MGDEPPDGTGPGGLQHKVAGLITGRHPRRLLYGRWEYPPMETAMQEAGFEEMEDYAPKRHNAHCIAMQKNLDL